MRTFSLSVVALAACILLGAAACRAAAITGELWLNRPAVAVNPTLSNVAALGAPDAAFTSNGISFNSTLNGFTLGGFLGHTTFNNPGIAGNDLYSLVMLLSGALTLHAGDNSFILRHDDGVQLFVAGFGIVVDQPAPTPAVDTAFNVVAPSAGDYAFQLSYANCCAPPAELLLQANVNTVPEPASLALLGGALLGFSAVVARRRRKV